MNIFSISLLAGTLLLSAPVVASASETSRTTSESIVSQRSGSSEFGTSEMSFGWRRGPWGGGWRRGPFGGGLRRGPWRGPWGGPGPGFCYYHPYAPRCRW